MKNLALFTVLGFAVLISSCSKSTIKNEFLGEIPSLEKSFSEEIQKKEKEIKECTDFQKTFKLTKELKLYKEECTKNMEENYNANPLTKPIPFEELAGMPYTIKGIKVKEAHRGSIKINFSVKLNEALNEESGSSKKFLTIYYKALDKDGKEIPNSKALAADFKTEELIVGKDLELNGNWGTKAIVNMENFAKVKVITKEEFEKR